MTEAGHVVIDALEKTFGHFQAVRGVSLTVPRGECLVLLGPSGCGKTTTLRCVAGFETPDRGRIVIGDRTVFDSRAAVHVPPARRDIAMVFQSYAVWPHMTVFENVAFPLRIRRVPRAEVARRVEQALAMVGLGGLERRFPAALSGGQMQRVALARSLVYEPSVLLLDEPLSNLDAVLRERLRFEIRTVLKTITATAIYVTHDQTEAVVLGDQIAVMNAGEVGQLGTPLEIFSRPATAFVADFIGATNRLPGTLVGPPQNGVGRLRLPTGDVLLGASSRLLDGAAAGAGTPCVAVFRPESLVLSHERPVTETNIWSGTIAETRFLGTYTAYVVESAVGEFTARVHEPRLVFTRGQRVWCALPQESAVLLAGGVTAGRASEENVGLETV